MNKNTFTIRLKNYNSHPRWRETSQVIEVLTKSGAAHPKLSLENRHKKLCSYLESVGNTYEWFQKLEAKSKREFYRVDNDDPESEIVIPQKNLDSCIYESLDRRMIPRGATVPLVLLRAILRVSEMKTGKTKADGYFDRYCTTQTSNAARHMRTPYLGEPQNEDCEDGAKPFDMTGTVEYDPSDIKEEAVKTLISFSIQKIGMGASRKMGFGRGELISFE